MLPRGNNREVGMVHWPLQLVFSRETHFQEPEYRKAAESRQCRSNAAKGPVLGRGNMKMCGFKLRNFASPGGFIRLTLFAIHGGPLGPILELES
jgi:hypothetical protein